MMIPLIQSHLEPLVSSCAVPGAALSFCFEDQAEHIGVGALEEGSKFSPRPTTMYETGSVGKVFTGLLLAEANRRGEVELDTPVSRLRCLKSCLKLPDGVDFTLRQLATHTAGLPWVPAELDLTQPDFFNGFSTGDLWRSLSAVSLESTPGETYCYSNYGVGLLGVILEHATGLAYAEQIRERITLALKLPDTTIELSADQRYRLAPPHYFGVPSFESSSEDALAASGCLRSTSADTLEFARHHMTIPDTPLGESIRLATERHFELPVSEEDQAIGFGWHIRDDGTHWHNGATFGYHAFVAFNRPNGVALALVANDVAPEVTTVGFRVLDVLLGKEPDVLALAPAATWSSDQVTMVTGCYSEDSTGAELRIFTDHERIMAQLDGQEAYRLFPRSDSVLSYRVVNATLCIVERTRSVIERLELQQEDTSRIFNRIR